MGLNCKRTTNQLTFLSDSSINRRWPIRCYFQVWHRLRWLKKLVHASMLIRLLIHWYSHRILLLLCIAERGGTLINSRIIYRRIFCSFLFKYFSVLFSLNYHMKASNVFECLKMYRTYRKTVNYQSSSNDNWICVAAVAILRAPVLIGQL